MKILSPLAEKIRSGDRIIEGRISFRRAAAVIFVAGCVCCGCTLGLALALLSFN